MVHENHCYAMSPNKWPQQSIFRQKQFRRQFFNRKGELKHIRHLKSWKLLDVLLEKYHFATEDAVGLTEFLLPILMFNPKRRASAKDCLANDWLEKESNTTFFV